MLGKEGSAMRSSLSSFVVWLLLSCAGPGETPMQTNAVQRAHERPTAEVVDPQAATRRAQKAGRSHDLRRAAMVDLVTRRLAVPND